MVSFSVNGKNYEADVDPRTPLLWVLRDAVGLTGTKYWLRHRPMRRLHGPHRRGRNARCSVSVSAVAAKKVTTIEGLAANGTLHPVQQAWIDNDVPQCGYCQTGMIMAVAALLKEKPKPTDADIDGGDHQHLPLRHLPTGARGDPRRRQGVNGGMP